MRTELPTVLFEDETLIAFDKPGGLLVAPDRWDKDRENLMTMVHERLSPKWFNVHRLDRETSGVLLCAKSRPVLRTMCRQFSTRETTVKNYLALVCGVPRETEGVIEIALRPDPRFPGRMQTASQGAGKPCETRFRVVSAWRGYALLQVELVTGRTHQIRVHMAACGTPVVGDRFYGQGRYLLLSELKPGYKFKRDHEELPLIRRLALHAACLTFLHPVSGVPVTVESPMPKDFRIGIKYLDRWVKV